MSIKLKLDKMMLDIAKKAIIDLSSRVVLGTPRDTTAAAKSWTPSLNLLKVDNVPTSINASSFSYPQFKIKSVVSGLSLGDKFYLANGKEYIEYLEHGSSNQSPSGMLFLNTAKWRGIVNDAV